MHTIRLVRQAEPRILVDLSRFQIAHFFLAGLLVAALLLAAVSAVTFEFARLFRVYDYRSLLKELIAFHQLRKSHSQRLYDALGEAHKNGFTYPSPQPRARAIST